MGAAAPATASERTLNIPTGEPSPPVVLLPALALVDRLRTSARLLVLIGVLLVPLAAAGWSYVSSVNGQIAFSDKERDGIDVVRPALFVMSDVVGGADPDLAELRDAVAASGLELDDPLAEVEAATAELDDPTARLEAARTLAGFVTTAGDVSNLILDPDLDSFYVMDALVNRLPSALVAAARAAAPPTDVGTDELIAEHAIEAGRLTGAADGLRAGVETSLGTTSMAGLDVLLAGLLTAADAAEAQAETLTAELADPSAVDAAPVADAVTGATPDAADAMMSLLDARIDGMAGDRLIALVIIVVGLVVAMWIAAAVWWRTRLDVTQVLGSVRAIAAGDLEDRPLSSRKDEFGEIGQAIATARAQLITSAVELDLAQQERERQLEANFAHQKEAEKQVRTRAQAIVTDTSSTVMAELSEVVGQVEAMREAAGNIDQQVALAERVTKTVVEQAQSTDALVATLIESLRRVAGITKLIAGIAEQSKLLALNATIEAARAGEAGRGFGVVADEVKDLATSTGQSTEEITTTVATLEQDTSAVSAAIAEVSTGIGELDAATETLRYIASEQRNVVGDLEQCISGALDRIRSMGGLTDKLERRRHERYLTSGAATLHHHGREHTINLVDISEGGLRARTSGAIGADEGAEVTVELPLASGARRIAAHVAHVRGEARDDLGLEFDPLEAGVHREIADHIEMLGSTGRLVG
ncbi:MAG: methyl-accepting chemotaxis protein [Actinomycetota bacterium]|nr:methyl-accepting chemotaxis protein [Actinomycetota bacterium]